MDYDYYPNYIVPFETEPPLARAPQPPSYETPWWVDTINRAIERGAQTAQVAEAGYPPYPTFPEPQARPMPAPYPGVTPQPREGIQLSQTTLMLLVGGVLLFMLGGRRR